MHFNRQKISPRSKLVIKPNNKRKKVKKVSPRKIDINARKTVKDKIRHQRKIKDVKVGRAIRAKKILYDHRKYKDLKYWKNLLKGQPAFILGNGLSISDQPLSLLNNYFTIGINRIFYIYDPTVLIWQDIALWKTNRDDILSCRAIKVSRDLSDPRKYFLNYKLAQDPPRFKRKPEYLHGRGNTGGISIQFAVALGCSPIIILGMDCKYGKNGKTDFYGKNKDHSDYTLSMCKKTMKWIKKHCPVSIYNCSDIDYWPKMDLKDVIKEIQPKKLGRKYFQKLFSK